MTIRVGEVEALFRYPVKSMAGEAVASVELGWHGLAGDRRLGLRRHDDRAGFPWLTASKLPELLRFRPVRRAEDLPGGLPSHVATPEGAEHGLFDEALAAEIGRRHGTPVEMTHFDRGIFDEASVSLISAASVEALAPLIGHPADARRYRPNILLATASAEAFEEDAWVGGLLSFGEGSDAATIAITNRDERCSVVNYDPDTAQSDPEVLKSVVRARDNWLGVYGTVVRRGRLEVGQVVSFEPTRFGSPEELGIIEEPR